MPLLKFFIDSEYRRLAHEGPLIVDRGLLTFPDAEISIWLDAHPMIRAERRKNQLEQRGLPAPRVDEILRQNADREWNDRIKKAMVQS